MITIAGVGGGILGYTTGTMVYPVIWGIFVGCIFGIFWR